MITTSSYGFPVDMFDLRCIVKSYADKKGMKIPVRQFRNNMHGKDWAACFLRRRSDLTVSFASNIKRKRAEVGRILWKPEQRTGGVAPSNIWNYDETNLSDELQFASVAIFHRTIILLYVCFICRDAHLCSVLFIFLIFCYGTVHVMFMVLNLGCSCVFLY